MTVEDEILSALRVYPFFEFDAAKIEKRAFALSAQGGDHLANWLEAERLETVAQAEEHLVFAPTAREFLRDYELVDKIRFVTNEPRHKEFRGDRRTRKCSICGVTQPMGKFRTEAHLLPACTGNRFLFTAEECDACNLDLGRAAEDDLGKMLSPHRALGRVQTRSKASTTLRLGDKHGSIGGQGRDEPLRVSLVEGSLAVEVHHVDEHTIELRARGIPYRPISALRSLARSAWHLLPQALKAANGPFLRWVRGELDVLPVAYIEAFIPGPGLRHTVFCVWQKRGPDGAQGLVFLLALANVVVVVPVGVADPTGFPLPPLPHSPYGLPRIRTVVLTRDEPITLTIAYEIRHLSRSLVEARGPMPVRVISRANDAVVELDCDLETIPARHVHEVIYSLHGGQLRGEVLVFGEPQRLTDTGVTGGTFKVAFQLAPEATTQGEPILTSQFVECLCSGATLSIELRSDGRSVVGAIALSVVPEFDAAALRAALGLL